MKITKSQLKQIIKEELGRIISEAGWQERGRYEISLEYSEKLGYDTPVEGTDVGRGERWQTRKVQIDGSEDIVDVPKMDLRPIEGLPWVDPKHDPGQFL
jgi:hypothetical protein